MIKLYYMVQSLIINLFFYLAMTFLLLGIGSLGTLYFLSQHTDQLCNLRNFQAEIDKVMKPWKN